jgi:uncharacterized radical SAM superfamily Fe-S cluster-containing enzyme
MLKAAFQALNQEKYVYKEKIDELKKYFLPWPFSSKSFYFPLTRNDWKIIKKFIPTILIYLTNRCNSFCKICYKNSSLNDYSEDLTLDEISFILKKIGKRKNVVLIGGEPTVREDIFEIIEMIRKTKNYPQLFTNGLKLANISFVKKLKNSGIKKVIVSFDGFSPEIYEKMRGGKRELLLKLLAIKNLEAERILTFISATIAKNINENEIDRLLKFCINSVKRNGSIRGILIYCATRCGRYLIENNSEMDTVELVKKIEELNLGIKIDYLIEMKKLLIYLNRIATKIGFPTPFGSGGLVGIYRVGSLKELIPIDKLREINRNFEAFNLKKMLGIMKLFNISEIKNFMIDPFNGLLNSNLFVVGMGNVHNPKNFSAFLTDVIGIEKNRRLGFPIGNYTNWSGLNELSDIINIF